ncbi:family 43 glycosylhydrolase [Cyclobacterium roseum]|uniref:family 43 glycosylhydrolase n=1 Tax=Cyclobacterium roseum TaxID=2666137 RepID=UPI001391CAFF|nr:family 43 glycosylhydrolase [Cyclobacterium roseum]
MRTVLNAIVVGVLLFSCGRSTSDQEVLEVKPVPAIVNPVLAGDRPDPTVIRVGDYYYASATSNEWAPLFPIFRSSDLVEWELVNYVFPNGAPGWARNNFWAPELAYDREQGRVYAYYTARDKMTNRLSVAVASSESPTGDFTDHGPLVAQEFGSIDAFEVRDERGTLYLLWKEDGNSQGMPTPMWAQEINEERTRLLGCPTELFRNDAPWEKNLVEGICVFKKGDYFFATYSAGACCDKQCNYQTGVARAKNLLGPWEKYSGNPILTDNEDWKCAGHGTVVEKDGAHFMLYHAYNTQGSVYVGREGVLEKINWTEDQWPVLDNTADYSREVASLDFEDEFKEKLDPLWQWRVTQDIRFSAGENGLFLNASEENEGMGSLLVQGTKATDYRMTTTIDLEESNAVGGILLVGAENNGFGAPIAGMGIGAGEVGVQVFEMRDGEKRILAEVKKGLSGEINLKMEVKEGYLIAFSYQSGVDDRQPLGETVDASHLVPWGMGFRLGMFALGTETQRANFLETKIQYTGN